MVGEIIKSEYEEYLKQVEEAVGVKMKMTEKELAEMCTIDRFAGYLIAYIADYFQGCGVHGKRIV